MERIDAVAQVIGEACIGLAIVGLTVIVGWVFAHHIFGI